MRAVILLVATLSIAPAFADPNEDPICSGENGLEATGVTEITLGNARAYYVDDRGFVTGRGLWLYEESNGVWQEKSPGIYRGADVRDDLQRGGASEIIPDDSEVCSDISAAGPDYLFF